MLSVSGEIIGLAKTTRYWVFPPPIQTDQRGFLSSLYWRIFLVIGFADVAIWQWCAITPARKDTMNRTLQHSGPTEVTGQRRSEQGSQDLAAYGFRVGGYGFGETTQPEATAEFPFDEVYVLGRQHGEEREVESWPLRSLSEASFKSGSQRDCGLQRPKV